MLSFQKHAPINFEVVAVNLDQKQPGFPEEILPEYLDKMGVAYDIIEQDTYSIVKRLTPEGKTTCPVCSRLRRGILYNHAQKVGATKIALGHHADDVVETLLLNMFYGAKLKAMPAKLRSDDGRNILIRPLYYCRESLISQWSDYAQYPIIPCNLCGSQDNLQRQVIKEMLVGWDQSNPGRVENIARSVNSVTLSHLGDRRHYDFEGLVAENRGVEAIEVENRHIDITEVR
jgi:tRNA 2-thiocytidine biosynthesis protein TtcA